RRSFSAPRLRPPAGTAAGRTAGTDGRPGGGRHRSPCDRGPRPPLRGRNRAPAGQWQPSLPATATVKPLLLLSTGDSDPDFLYATHFSVESAIYVRFEDGDDLLVVGSLELERARAESQVASVVEAKEA